MVRDREFCDIPKLKSFSTPNALKMGRRINWLHFLQRIHSAFIWSEERDEQILLRVPLEKLSAHAPQAFLFRTVFFVKKVRGFFEYPRQASVNFL